MDGTGVTIVLDRPIDVTLLDKVMNNQLSECDALALARLEPEIIAFTMLALQQRIAGTTQSTGPNTPPSTIPPFSKPAAKPSKGKEKRGGQAGHTGRTRPPLPDPDRTREHQHDRCPDCDGVTVHRSQSVGWG